MTIDWTDPSDDVLYARGVGYDEGVKDMAEVQEQLSAALEAQRKAEADNAAMMLLLREVHNEPVCLPGVRPGQALLDELEKAEGFKELLKEVVENDSTPESNCSCHISPPCNDCVEHAEQRDLIARIKAALAASPEGKGNTQS